MNREHALLTLRRLRDPLMKRGVARIALFGSLARGQGTHASDVDVVITPAVDRRLDLVDLGGVQTLLDEAFGCDVDLVVEPVRGLELRRAIARERLDAF